VNALDPDGSREVLRLALLGHPVGHSLSPALHQAAGAACGLEVDYQLLDTPPHLLDATMARLRDAGYRGYNITAPHKQAVHARVHTLTDAAEAVGAVNTVVLSNGQALGDNTDVAGLRQALTAANAPEGHAVVIGTGGTARAAIHVLRTTGRDFAVHGRDRAKARELHHRAGDWSELSDALRGVSLVVLCLARAAAPALARLPFDATAPDALVFDVNYGVAARPVAEAVVRAGRRGEDGLRMLAWQGLAAFERWTGLASRAEPVLEAVRDAAAFLDTQEEPAIK